MKYKCINIRGTGDRSLSGMYGDVVVVGTVVVNSTAVVMTGAVVGATSKDTTCNTIQIL